MVAAYLNLQEIMEIILMHDSNYPTCRETATTIFDEKPPDRDTNYSTVEKFNRRKGYFKVPRQGCALSAILFNIYSEEM